MLSSYYKQKKGKQVIKALKKAEVVDKKGKTDKNK